LQYAFDRWVTLLGSTCDFSAARLALRENADSIILTFPGAFLLGAVAKPSGLDAVFLKKKNALASFIRFTVSARML
jgi:hypothetical protein